MTQLFIVAFGLALTPLSPPAGWAAELPIFDAQIYYSHDTRDALPAKTAIETLREAGVERALVSSSTGDYHITAAQTLFNRPILNDLDRDLRYTNRVLGEARTWKAIGLGAGLTLLSATADNRVDRWARDNGQRSGAETAANFGNALPFAALAGAGLLALAGEGSAADTGYTAVESAVTAAAVSVAIKYAVGRLRPGVGQNNHDFEPFEGSLSDKSFPSDRTTLMWATVTPFAKEYDAPWLYGLAAFTNFGRIADREHWFSDTVAGSLLGYAIGSLLWESHRQPGRKTTDVALTGNGVVVRSRW